MDLQSRRDLQLLSEVEKDSSVTQRTLAKSLGVALGLTNLYLKRLARKGYIKITTIPRNRIKYLLTPRGVAEKSRLTYEYMQYSLFYYRDVRQKLEQAMAASLNAGFQKLLIYGTGEVAELAYLIIRANDLALVGFVDAKKVKSFLSYPVWPLEAMSHCDFDAVVIAELDNAEGIRSQIIRQGTPAEKIIALARLS